MLDRTRSSPEPEPHRRKRAPRGYERYGSVNWGSLTEQEIIMVCEFDDALVEIRRNELELFRLALSAGRHNDWEREDM